MTLALTSIATTAPGVDLAQELHERVTDWGDLFQAADAAASLLTRAIRHSTVSVYGYDAASQELQLLAAAPSVAPGGTAVGTRSRLAQGPLARAVRDGAPQRALDSYIDADFVRSLPGETRSELAVPILGASGVVGALQVVYPAPFRPEARDQESAEAIARALSGALDGARGSRPRESDAAHTAAVLARLAGTLASTEDLAPALQQVADGALQLAAGESALVLFRHASRQALEVAATAGAAPLEPGALVMMENTIPGEVARTARTLSWRRAPGEKGFGIGDAELAVRDALAVPLRAGGKTFGVLAVLNRTEAGPFTPPEVERLQSLAYQAAAIEPLRQIGPLRQRLSDSSLLAEVGRAVTGTLGLDEVLALVVRAAEMLIGTRGVALGLITEEGDGLRIASASGALRKGQGSVIPIHASLLGEAVRTAETVISPCVSDDPRSFALPDEVRQGPAVVIPLESRARIWGALIVTKAEGAPPPSDQDVDALRKLAGYASIAIDNAQLYREQMDLSEMLRAQADELQRAYAELRESQERLVVSEKMAALGRITAGIAHEINSPLGGILNCLQLAQSYAGEYQSSIRSSQVTPEDHEAIATDLLDALNMAQVATRKVAQFVRTIKGQTRTGDDAVYQVFEVGQEVEGVLSLLAHELRNRNVVVHAEVEPGLKLAGDPGNFSLVVQNLVNNAIDAYENSEGNVWVRARHDGGALVLEVEDAGCGIPESIRPRIFDYLFTTKDVGQGTGLGLSTVHSIVTSSFRGEIDLHSQVGVGTTFVVRFPLPAQSD